MASRWVNQREFAPSRVQWIVEGMSLRTQEAVSAARFDRQPDFNRVDIVAEDIRFHIKRREGEELRALMLKKYIELKFDGVWITIRVMGVKDEWHEESFMADEPAVEWAFALYADVLQELAE